MTRHEFTAKTKKPAKARSGGICEASGPLYGLPWDIRCTNSVVTGGEYDHEILTSEGGDASLENCRLVCKAHHAFKTRKIDIPKAAKIRRIRARIDGTRRKRKAIPSRGFEGVRKFPKKPLDGGG